MNCRECHERFSPYHDGALDAVEAGEVSGHLETCPSCGREWEVYRRAMRAIGGAPPEPPGLASRVDGAWRGAPPEREALGCLSHAVVFAIAAFVTVIILRSC